MKTTIKFDDFKNITNAIIHGFCETVNETLASRPEVFTEEYKKIFSCNACPSDLIFVEDEVLSKKIKNDKGEEAAWEDKVYSRKDIAVIYNKGDLLARDNTPAKAHMGYTFEDGKLVIKRLEVVLNYDILVKDVLLNLYRINDYYEKVIRTWAKHEAGHILDYILSFVDKTPAQVKKLDGESAKARKEYSKWFKTALGKERCLPPELERQRLEMYFNIPCEARADILGGVDRNGCIDFSMADFGKRVIATIKSKSVNRDKS